MTDAHDAHDPHAGHGPNVKAYFTVFLALGVCTALSFVFNYMARHEVITHLTSAGMIMAVAVVKAVLVAMIFMHLKWDWSRLYFIICPLFILATMMVIVLMPDLVIYWKNN